MAEQAQANPNGLMHIGAVAAHNIAAFLNLDVKHVGVIEQAIKDEINAMSSHFALAMRDVSDQYEMDVAKIKSTYTYVSANKGLVAIALGTVWLFGLASGLIAAVAF